MSSPNWEEAPDWANWVAQDVEGEWYWYKDKPNWIAKIHGSVWDSNGTLHKFAYDGQPVTNDISKRSLKLRPGTLKKLAQSYANRS